MTLQEGRAALATQRGPVAWSWGSEAAVRGCNLQGVLARGRQVGGVGGGGFQE